MATGFVFDERYMWHDTGSAAGYTPAGRFIQPEPHVDSPESKRRFRKMLNTSETYRSMTLLLKELANEICQDRLLMVQEGGYSTTYVPFCGLAVMEALSGIKTEVVDPYLEFYEGLTGQELQPHQDAVIKECEELAAKVK